MDSAWEDDASMKKPSNSYSKNQWEGEDEDDDVQESWDQEPDVDEELHEEPLEPIPIPNKHDKKRKKEDDHPMEEEAAEAMQDVHHDLCQAMQEMTPEQIFAEQLVYKLKEAQRRQEETELNLAKEMLSECTLETKEDFEQFKEEITGQLSECTKNADYAAFAEQIIQSLCSHLSPSDLKKVHNQIGILHIEKQKQEKAEKAKKHKHKIRAKLKVGDETNISEYSAFSEDFGDFM